MMVKNRTMNAFLFFDCRQNIFKPTNMLIPKKRKTELRKKAFPLKSNRIQVVVYCTAVTHYFSNFIFFKIPVEKNPKLGLSTVNTSYTERTTSLPFTKRGKLKQFCCLNMRKTGSYEVFAPGSNKELLTQTHK